MKRSISQLRAIGYAARAKAKAKRFADIMSIDGSLDNFKKSGYKSMYWYLQHIKKMNLNSDDNREE